MASKKKTEEISESLENEEYQLSLTKKEKKIDKSELLSQLNEMNQDDYVPNGITNTSSFLPSSLLSESRKSSSKKKQKEEDDDLDDSWFDDWVAFDLGSPIKRGKKKIKGDIFGLDESKKKKKKKNKTQNGVELVDYKKEFETETSLFKNLLMEQTKFTEALQREYDNITSNKGTSRGITKQLTDLVANINNARQLSMNLIEKTVGIKKTIADLNLKQKKELGAGVSGEENGLVDFGSAYMKSILDNRNSLIGNNGEEGLVEEYTEDDIFDEIGNRLSEMGEEYGDGEDASDNTNQYLKYENQNVEIHAVVINGDVDNYYFEAIDEEGNLIEDYPLPMKTKLSINRSQGIARDTLGQQFVLDWIENDE